MLPAIVGILVKLYLLLSTSRRAWISKSLIGLVWVMALHNLSELLLFNSFVRHLNADYLMRAYYVCTICISTYAFAYAAGEKFIINRLLSGTVACAAFTLILVVMVSDHIIVGTTALTYTITAIKGEAYWLFQSFALIVALSTLYRLIVNYFDSKSAKEQIRNFYALASMIPLIFTVVLIVSLMSFGVQVNATFVFPIATTLFLLILVKGKYSQDLNKDPRSLIPFSAEAELDSSMKNSKLQYCLGEIDHKEFIASLEKSVIIYNLSKHGGNISKTAEAMRIKRTTLYGKFKAFEIDYRGS